ncbi:hypothetical protein EVA_06084 [gut metagenome]|uniref:Uncharacterized protein n=1 Tax=gut metagenome TaxID=749906 RepID=J9GYB2_9ZZZZ
MPASPAQHDARPRARRFGLQAGRLPGQDRRHPRAGVQVPLRPQLPRRRPGCQKRRRPAEPPAAGRHVPRRLRARHAPDYRQPLPGKRRLRRVFGRGPLDYAPGRAAE